ncbi:MAG: Wzz/FepE/Etk N-terminal domain-containing protein [Streptococcaceae bacterium]|jgi:capsular polysaccharide biosynthesis protein|nr:Wzz/FepE/Etk N-terminal domain-containing protein [Streptococcaceae bacterium]MCH4176942.1 Wzz/FepE/Etk N-terminal domain-containing protein [Streptococcaceae bacterium]
MEEQINLENILKIIKKHISLLVTSMLLGILVSAVITFLVITPKFNSSAQLIVQSKDENNTNLQGDINGNVLLINTYKDMIMGNFVMDKAQQQLAANNYQITIDDLKNSVSILQTQDSQMFQIVSTLDNPKDAALVTNTVATVFKERAGEVLDVRQVTIISEGQVNDSPVSPNKKVNLIIGWLVGLMLGLGLIFLREMLDKTVKDEQFVPDNLGFPILGTVSEFQIRELELNEISVLSDKLKLDKNEILSRREINRNRKRI